MNKLRNRTHEALRPLHALFHWRNLPHSWNEDLEESDWDFSKNAYRNVRKAYFDGRTTQSEFCFETNILCNQRSV